MFATERRQTWNAELRKRFDQVEQRWNRVHPTIVCDTSSVLGASSGSAWDARVSDLAGLDIATLRTQRPNLLLVGSHARVADALDQLAPTFCPPIMAVAAAYRDLTLPAAGTLILLQVDELSLPEQHSLFARVARAAWKIQIVSTASFPLFPSVVRGSFIEPLFYRLNHVTLLLREHPQLTESSPTAESA